MNKQLTVGIVILTYNSAKFIDNCILSVLKNNYRNKLCVIVDNNSTDETFDIVKKKYPNIKIIKNKSNLGYAAGNNSGIQYLLQKKNISHILILNPDTLVSNNLISNMIEFMNADKNIGIAGPILTYANKPDTIWFAGGYLNSLFMYTKHPNMNKNINAIKIQSGTTDFITGACMMVVKDVFEKIGLLPEDYFMYFEDVDFCQNAIKNGFTCHLFAKPLTRHFVSASSGIKGSNELTPLRAYYYARNPFTYIKRNVKGFRIATNYLGQIFIRLPYYIKQTMLKLDRDSFIQYLRGVFTGLFKIF